MKTKLFLTVITVVAAMFATTAMVGCAGNLKPGNLDLGGSKVKTVSLATQQSTLTAGTAGSSTFAVTTENIADGQTGSVSWFTGAAGTTAGTKPAGIDASVSAVSNNSATVIMNAAVDAVKGNYYFKVTIDGTTSAVAMLTIDEDGGGGELNINHPAGLVTQADIDRVKARVAAADPNDPVYASWLRFCNSSFANPLYYPAPVETLVRGDPSGTGATENYIVADKDAAAAMQLAIRWHITGDTRFADKAIDILNQWAKTCKRITANDNNQYLLAGFQGYQFANAGELMRNYSGWKRSEFNAFKTWMREVWYSKNYWFLTTHGGSGVCNLHYWSNWELANLASVLAIGILLEDPEIINFGYMNFREGEGSCAINNMIPFDPAPDPEDKSVLLAQNMESGRDQGHSTLVISICAEVCKIAQSIGLDFFGMENDKVLAMAEYTAKYNVRVNGSYITPDDGSGLPPFQRYEYCQKPPCSGHGAIHTRISNEQRGTIRPCWDLIWNHYKAKGVEEKAYYYTKLFADQTRYLDGVLTGDRGAGDSSYNNGTSGTFDQVGWSTMLFYQD